MSMIERVAKAIATSAQGDDESWKAWEDEAIAAIKAMREPTEGMHKAHEKDFNAWLEERIEDEWHMWKAMIDAALEGK